MPFLRDSRLRYLADGQRSAPPEMQINQKLFGIFSRFALSLQDAMIDRTECIRKLKASKNVVTDRFGVHSMRLFGSVARNEQSESSDVDICVEMAPSRFRKKLKNRLTFSLYYDVKQDLYHYPKNTHHNILEKERGERRERREERLHQQGEDWRHIPGGRLCHEDGLGEQRRGLMTDVGLILQAAYGDDIYPILSLIGILSYADDNCHK